MDLLHPKQDAQSESTASSVASGSSDVINAIDKNIEIENEIRKEVDKLFVPALERTNSSGDFNVTAPLRHKRRQYRSQEVLPIDETAQNNRAQNVSHALPSQSEQQISNKNNGNMDKLKHIPIPILYDSQRAEIVASVTERLYSKLKKKEEIAVSKMESVVDKKIIEPLNELKICTNARQRLIELSHKALRNKRRIGIPAHTQTRITATRVRDQGIDVQTDLEAYVYRNRHFYSLQRDAATETEPITPRCKEAAVGSRYGTLDLSDSSTITESKPQLKNSFVMTDVVLKYDRFTQTPIVPPPRRKKRMSSFSKYLKAIELRKTCQEECSNTVNPVINIHISHPYSADKESQSSDENTGLSESQAIIKEAQIVTMTPDLLTNHSTVESNAVTVVESSALSGSSIYCKEDHDETAKSMKNDTPYPSSSKLSKPSEDFSDPEDCSLPRVIVNNTPRHIQTGHDEMKDMILGRNDTIYPYNIVLSPPRERENSRRIVKFKDIDFPVVTSTVSQTSCDWDCKSSASNVSIPTTDNNMPISDKEYVSCKDSEVYAISDSTESSKLGTDSFIWKKGHEASKSVGFSPGHYTPVYKSNSRYKSARARFYREFLGLDKPDGDFYDTQCSQGLSSNDNADLEEDSRYKFRQRRNFFEGTFNKRGDYPANDFEKLEQEILSTCDDLEISANKYDNYLSSLNTARSPREAIPVRTPTEYLQHLVQLRREVVKADCGTDSCLGISRK